MLTLVALAIGVPALVAFWVYIFPHRFPTPMLVLTASPYLAPAPPNAFATENADRFAAVFGKDDGGDSIYRNIGPSTAATFGSEQELLDGLKGFLAGAAGGGPDRETVVVYLNVHGAVNDAGEPCFLLPDQDPLDASTWTPVAEVLTAASPPPGKEFTTVLLLDAHQIDDAWPMGIVANTFPSALARHLEESLPAGVAIIVAATGLEASVAAPELGGTAFAYYAARGLRGEADRPDEDGDRDAVVTVAELETYLREQVGGWAARHRGVGQHPMLFGEGARAVADVSGSEAIDPQPWKSPVSPATFGELFAAAQALQDERVYALNPLAWARLQTLFERLDAEALAGKAYEAAARDGTLNELRSVIAELENERALPEIRPLTLAMRNLLEDSPPTDAVAATWAAWQEKPLETQVTSGFENAASFTWTRLADASDVLSRRSFDDAAAFLTAAGTREGEEFAEIALVRLLKQHVDWGSEAVQKLGVPAQLLAARRTSEELATPVDPRLHYVIAPLAAPLDLAWASALDQTLVGDDDSLYHAGQTSQRLKGDGEGSYGEIKILANRVREAIELRDDTLMSALHLNRWWARRARQTSDVRRSGAVQKLVDNALAVSELLDGILANGQSRGVRAADEELAQPFAQLRTAMSDLMRSHGDRMDAVIEELQGSPDVTAVDSPELLRCLVRIGPRHAQLHDEWMKRLAVAPKDGSAASAKAVDNESELAYLQWLATDGTAPLAALLDEQRLALAGATAGGAFPRRIIHEDSKDIDVELALAELGGQIRARLTVVDEQSHELADRTPKGWSREPAGDARRGLSQADVLSRALAPLAAPSLAFGGVEPTQQLRKLDAQAWVLWQGQRALDDCWGTWDEAGSGTPYFARLAGVAADEGERLADAPYPAGLRGRTGTLLDAVNKWLPLETSDLPAVDGQARVTEENPLIFNDAPSLPPGIVAVYVAGATDSSQDFRRFSAEMREPTAFSDSLNPLPKLAPLFAKANFRGHVRPTLFNIGEGVLVDWVKPDPAPATVIVQGDDKLVSQVIFVFDCSYSMIKQFEGDTRNRVAEGRQVLGDLLTQLTANGEQFHVGLIVYGARTGWRGNKLVPNVPGLVPGNDVDVRYARPEPLTKLRAAELKEFLDGLLARGQTPLYFALKSAAESFHPTLDGSRHIIAITDGVNEVSPLLTAREYTDKDVTDALAKMSKPARVDVVEFALDEARINPNDLKTIFTPGRNALRKITTARGGAWHEAADTVALNDVLLESLQLEKYGVEALGAPALRPDDFHELGSLTELLPPLAPVEYDVRLKESPIQPARVVVEGGEAVKLVYQRIPDPRLLFPVEEPLDWRGEPQQAGGFLVHAILPAAQGGEMAFRFSLQTGDELKFSRRPAVIWAKVTPQNADDARPFYFMDREFVPRQSVPVLQLRAPGWPGAGAGRVELTVAAAVDEREVQQFPIPADRNEVEFHLDQITLEAEIGIARDGAYDIVIDERHPRDVAAEQSDYPLHVQIEPPPDRISRTFFDETREARYEFHYKARPTSPTLRVLTRREIERGSDGAKFVFDGLKPED
jgi:hypothetical protein